MTNGLNLAGVVGDGEHDDTAGLQAALDSGTPTLHLPVPPAAYLISQTLRIHSGQTLSADTCAVFRLADHAHAHMLTNAEHVSGDSRITVLGGIWDGNNAHQTCEYHEGGNWRVPYDRTRYLGVLMQFNRVTDLRVAHVTLKDPETFGVQVGNLNRFTIEDVTFDYNLLRGNMDGVHVHGNSRQGRVANLKGTTNDDLVALNADDGSMFEMSRGPITDIVVDGVWSQNGYTAVRLLSAGSPVQRVRITNVFGTYRHNVLSLTNHRVHPGEPSRFEDISIDGVFCTKAAVGDSAPASGPAGSRSSPIRIETPARVSSLSIHDYHRTETSTPADDIHIEEGATVENLMLSDVTVVNRCDAPMDLIRNCGVVENLGLLNVALAADDAVLGGRVVRNEGEVHRVSQAGVMTSGYDPGL